MATTKKARRPIKVTARRRPRRLFTRLPKLVNLNRMSKARARVLIVKDIIKHLKTNPRIKPTHGRYFDTASKLYTCGPEMIARKGKDARQMINEIPSCRVCQIGALFVTAVMLHNRLPSNNVFSLDGDVGDWRGDTISDEVMRNYLKKWFDADQLMLMEQAFEHFVGIADSYINLSGSPRERMIAICENVIKNNGTFVPDYA